MSIIKKNTSTLCTKCNRCFATKHTLKMHLNLCGVKFRCSCEAQFLSKRSLLIHVRRLRHKVPSDLIHLFSKKGKLPSSLLPNALGDSKKILLPNNNKVTKFKLLTFKSNILPISPGVTPFICFPLNKVILQPTQTTVQVSTKDTPKQIAFQVETSCNPYLPVQTKPISFQQENIAHSAADQSNKSNDVCNNKYSDSMSTFCQTDVDEWVQPVYQTFTGTQTNLSSFQPDFPQKDSVFCQTDDLLLELGIKDLPHQYNAECVQDLHNKEDTTGSRFTSSGSTTATNTGDLENQICFSNTKQSTSTDCTQYPHLSWQTKTVQTSSADTEPYISWNKNLHMNHNMCTETSCDWNHIHTQTDTNHCMWEEQRSILTNSCTQTYFNELDNEPDFLAQLLDIETQTDPHWNMHV